MNVATIGKLLGHAQGPKPHTQLGVMPPLRQRGRVRFLVLLVTLSRVPAGMLRDVTHLEAQLLVLWNRRVHPLDYRQEHGSWLALPNPFP